MTDEIVPPDVKSHLEQLGNECHYDYFYGPKVPSRIDMPFPEFAYLTKKISRSELTKCYRNFKKVSPKHFRIFFGYEKIFKMIQKGSFQIKAANPLLGDNLNHCVFYAHESLYLNAGNKVVPAWFQNIFSLSDIFQFIYNNHINGTILFEYNQVAGQLLYGFMSNYFLVSFGHCRRIDPQMMGVIDPLTRTRIREENLKHPHWTQLYSSKTFNLKEFLFMAGPKVFNNSSVTWAFTENIAPFAYLDLVESMYAYGFLDTNDSLRILKLMQMISSSLVNLEKLHIRDQTVSESWDPIGRRLFLHILLHIITLVNDTAVAQVCSKNENPLRGTVRLENSLFQLNDIAFKLFQQALELPLNNHDKNLVREEFNDLFNTELLPLFLPSNQNDAYLASLELLQPERLKAQSLTPAELERARNALADFHNALMENIFRNADDNLVNQVENDPLVQVAFERLAAHNKEHLARGSAVFGYLLWLWNNLTTYSQKNLTDSVCDLLMEVSKGSRTGAASMFSRVNFPLFKDNFKANPTKGINLLALLAKHHGGDFFLSMPKLVDFLLEFAQAQFVNYPASWEELFFNAQELIDTFTIIISSSVSRNHCYEEFCVRVQELVLGEKAFITDFWASIQKTDIFQDYDPESETKPVRQREMKPCYAFVSVVRLLAASTKEVANLQVTSISHKVTVPEYFFRNLDKFGVLLFDLLELYGNLMPFEFNNYGDINIQKVLANNKSVPPTMVKNTKDAEKFVEVYEQIFDNFEKLAAVIKQVSPEVASILQVKARRIVITQAIKLMKGVLATDYYLTKTENYPKRVENVEKLIIDPFLKGLERSWALWPEVLNIPKPKAPYVFLELPDPKEFNIPESVLDPVELKDILVVRIRIRVCHALIFLEALVDDEEMMKHLHRDLFNSYQDFLPFLPKADAPGIIPPIGLKKPKIQEEEGIVAEYLRVKEKGTNDDQCIIAAWNASFDLVVQYSLNYFLFEGLTMMFKKAVWYHSNKPYVLISLFNYLLVYKKDYRRDVYLSRFLMKKTVDPDDRVYDFQPLKHEESKSQAPSSPTKTGKLEIFGVTQESEVLVDKLFHLYTCYFYRVLYKQFHDKMWDRWRKRFNLVINTFQNLCEQNFKYNKIFICQRKPPGQENSIGREIQRTFNELLRTDPGKQGDGEGLWKVNVILKKEIHQFDRVELFPEFVRILELKRELVIGCKESQMLFYNFGYFMYIKITRRDFIHPGSEGWKINLAMLNFLNDMLSDRHPLILTYVATITDVKIDLNCMETLVLNAYKAKGDLTLKKPRGRKVHAAKDKTKIRLYQLINAYNTNISFAKNQMVQCAFLFFQTLTALSRQNPRIKRILREYHVYSKTLKKEGRIQLDNPELEGQITVFAFVRMVFRKIELMFEEENDQGEMELHLSKKYFAKNPKLNYINPKTIKQFFEEVTLDGRRNKFTELFNQCEVFQRNMNANYSVQAFYPLLFSVFSPSNFKLFEQWNYYLSILLNLFVLFSFEWESNEFQIRKDWARYTILAMAALLLAQSIFFLFGWVLVNLRGHYEVQKHVFLKNHIKVKRLGPLMKLYILLFPSLVFQSEKNGYIITIITTALFFYFQSPMVLSIQLVQIANLSSTAQYVISSITQNLKQLLVTTVLGIFIIFTYAVITAEFFRSQMSQNSVLTNDNSDSSDYSSYCDSLVECFFYIFNQGVRESGIGAVFYYISFSSRESLYVIRFLLDYSFFIVINIIILNIVFGIIIDKFSEMRDASQKRERIETTTCFICELKKGNLQRKGIDFRYHCQKVHNPMKYVDLYLTILGADKKNLTAIEQYIWDKVRAFDYSWIPEGTTSKMKDNAEASKENEMLEKLKPTVTEGIVKAKDDLQESSQNLMNSMKTQIGDIVFQKIDTRSLKAEITADFKERILKMKKELLEEIGKI